jgi:hypothetical protein
VSVPDNPDEESVCELLDCLHLFREHELIEVRDASGFIGTAAIVEVRREWWWSDRSRWEGL